jgi:hypothetical protein
MRAHRLIAVLRMVAGATWVATVMAAAVVMTHLPASVDATSAIAIAVAWSWWVDHQP